MKRQETPRPKITEVSLSEVLKALKKTAQAGYHVEPHMHHPIKYRGDGRTGKSLFSVVMEKMNAISTNRMTSGNDKESATAIYAKMITIEEDVKSPFKSAKN